MLLDFVQEELQAAITDASSSHDATTQTIVPIVKTGQLTATRTVIYRRNAVPYGTG